MAFNIIEFTEKINGLFEGKSQTELAEMLEISQTMVSALKKGKIQSPGIDTVYRIAEKFNVSVDWLLGLAENPTTNKATKQLCATLGLSDETIEFLANPKNQWGRDVFNFLFKQHEKATQDPKTIEDALENHPPYEYLSILLSLSSFLTVKSLDKDILINLSMEGKLDIAISDIKEIGSENIFSDTILKLKGVGTYISFIEASTKDIIDDISKILSSMAEDRASQIEWQKYFLEKERTKHEKS